MLPIETIRKDTERVKKNLSRRNDKEILKKLDDLIKKDKKWREIKQKADELRHKSNEVSEKINRAKKNKEKKNADKLIKNAKKISKKIEKTENREKDLKKEIDGLMLRIPNLLDEEVPDGKDEKDNPTIKKWGEKAKIKNPKSHMELGEKLDILDVKKASEITGSGFYIFKKELAILERALINFFLDFHKDRGRTEICSPILANEDTAIGTAHLPKFDKDMFKTREGYYLIPTAEMTLTNLHKKETLKEKDLPKKYCAFTPCFRTEAGKHGSETPGIYRLHQFDKVEMVTMCKPENHKKYLKEMLEDAEELLKKLKIPYRVIVLCSGDNGFKESITYDIETWSPYMEKYMETSSVSTCLDFQARRMNTRYQSKDNELKYIYTLNGSGLALPRLIIAILENYQQEDGSIKIPKALQKYTGFKKIG